MRFRAGFDEIFFEHAPHLLVIWISRFSQLVSFQRCKLIFRFQLKRRIAIFEHACALLDSFLFMSYNNNDDNNDNNNFIKTY